MPPPRLVATIGLHASASTWVFNVVRELMIAGLGEAAVVAAYADTVAEVPDEATRGGRHMVIKSHHGSAELDAWLAAERVQVVFSVRDPRDAAISMSQRFKTPLDHTVRWLVDDCNRLIRLIRQGHMLLRYEQQFFARSAAVVALARVLDLVVSDETMNTIAARYSTEAVRSFAQRIADLPAERVQRVGSSHLMDPVTQIHGPHIGDGRSGKWRDLPAPLQAELTRLFGPFLDRFGYPR